MSTLVKMISLFALAVAVVMVPQQTVSAKDPVARVRMTARIAGVKAVAKYEERGARRKFNFQLELATPGASGTVSAVAADGSVVPMGSFTVDALGRGIIDIDTTEGDFVADPERRIGDHIGLQGQYLYRYAEIVWIRLTEFKMKSRAFGCGSFLLMESFVVIVLAVLQATNTHIIVTPIIYPQ